MKSDDAFISNLRESREAVWVVAAWLASSGYTVKILPSTERPSFESRGEHADNGDIEIVQRVEVKRRGLAFTCARDYPYDTVIVDECYKVDRIPGRHLHQYVILSSDMSCACIVPGKTKDQWTKKAKYDRADGQTREFYECPLSSCIFCQLEG